MARVRNLIAPIQVIYIDGSNWIQDDALFDDVLHRLILAAARFSQRLGSLSGRDSANHSTHSAAAFAEESLCS